jgi:drug/metabolite transporter (DMT)-like permease
MMLVALLYILFASTFTLGKAVLAYISPILFIGIRMVAGGALLLGYQYFFNRKKWHFDWADISYFFHIALFLIFISFVGEFWALQYVTSSKACLLYNMSPFITALFAYHMLSENLSRKQWIALCIGFLGFLPILINQTSGEAFTKHFWFLSMPELLLLAAVVSSCYGWMVMRYLVIQRDYSSIMVNGIGMAGGGIMALIASLAIEGIPQVGSISLDQVMIVAAYTTALILIANVVCFNLYGLLLRRYSATFLSFAGVTTPLFAAAFDLIFFKEPVTLGFILTMIIVFIGLWLFYQDDFKAQTK